jgi:hypothetical protein
LLFYDPWLRDVERFPHHLEALPAVAFHLAALVEHTIDRVPGGVEELAEHPGVSNDSVVVEVTRQPAAQRRRQLIERTASFAAQPFFQEKGSSTGTSFCWCAAWSSAFPLILMGSFDYEKSLKHAKQC